MKQIIKTVNSLMRKYRDKQKKDLYILFSALDIVLTYHPMHLKDPRTGVMLLIKDAAALVAYFEKYINTWIDVEQQRVEK